MDQKRNILLNLKDVVTYWFKDLNILNIIVAFAEILVAVLVCSLSRYVTHESRAGVI